MTRMLSGHPQNLPMPPVAAAPDRGAGRAPSPTRHFPDRGGSATHSTSHPDEHTGIGIWTEDIFMKTIRNRTALGRRPTDIAADAVVQLSADDR